MQAEDIRIARSLIGTTHAQLAAYIGVRTRTPPSAPLQNLDTLGAALRTVIGWYHEAFGDTLPSGHAAPGDTAEPHALVRQYLSLRSEWESREAHLMAARVSSAVPAMVERPLQMPEAAAPVSAAVGPAKRRRALLVDDASEVLVTVGAFLEVFGFEVVRASNGDMALKILADGNMTDLLVTDHAMPGMTGSDLVVQACQQDPGLRALIITGYPGAAELTNLPPGVALLAKPFRRAELAAHVRRLFNEARLIEATEPSIPTA